MKTNKNDIAIIGLSFRFPGADNVNDLWDIIKDGKETITYYSREELIDKGLDSKLLSNRAYVFAGGAIESGDKFDSSFFGYTPREADFMDPQHRVFLEECYSAIENSGYDPEKFTGEIGVFAGCSTNRYWKKNLSQHPEIIKSLGALQTIVNNEKDFLTTRVSYKLNLKGPSADIQTACSTSLVSIHFACQNLITHQCDMALGGGVFINCPRGEGYIFEKGNIDSPTGHCRPFDKNADGTIFGEGVGVVVLKRLEDAIYDRDSIIAVIKATAINNDGSQRVGYMAPGVAGQAKVISKAFDLAGIDPDTISYIETHGTGTNMGDPIEVEALRRVYSTKAGKKNHCALGSVKANMGHLDAAAGVAGLIKTALVLKNRQIPPLANFSSPNPELDLEDSPFYVSKEINNWDEGGNPRRAAVSSFGIGGTNSHAILEEWIPKPSVPSTIPFHLLPISAKTDKALQKMYDNIIAYLSEATEPIADIAFTLQNGRKEFKYRGLLILGNSDSKQDVFTTFPYFKGFQKLINPRTIFMFTGQGSQYSMMAKGLYEHFDSVKTIIDYANTLLYSNHNLNLLEILFNESEKNKDIINETANAQPVLFVVQYAIANLLMEYGVRPHYLIGHSIGEITAACLSGVFTFEDALEIVFWRGKLMQEQLPGGMLSVNLSKDKIIPLLFNDIELALNNAPNFCVVSGTFDAVDKFQEKVLNEYPSCHVTRLKTSHAFHSKLMEPALEPFLEILEKIEFGSINIPFISNVTGTWITNDQAISPKFWASHIRSTVNFSDGIAELIKDANSQFIEVGPGNSLSMLLSQFSTKTDLTTLTTVRHPRQVASDIEFFFKTLASFWLNGGIINWESLYADENRYRVPLPSYPFERIRHWIDPKERNNDQYSNLSAEVQINQYSGSDLESVDIKTKSSELYHSRPSLDNEFIPAETGIEKRIAAIWEELLGIKGIGITDNFFYLGGHSLLASQIINRINEEFASKVTIEKFFDFPTIKGLIENEAFEEQIIVTSHESAQLNYNSSLPLSPSQERLWIINQVDNNTPAYNISFSYIFEGTLEKNIFQKSLETLFERHKILKSYIRIENGQPVAFLDQNSGIHISELNYSELLGNKLEDKIQEFIENESRFKFIIEEGPLYKISLLNLAKNKILFHFTVHHLIFDGWSWGVFTKELKEIYDSLLSGRKPNLEPIRFDYFEYADLASQMDPDKVFQSSKEFWKNKLNGITGHLNFPLDFKRKEISTGEGGRVALNIDKEKADKIREYSNKANVTLYMYILSVFGYLLSRYTGKNDICLGSPTANRPGAKIERLIGLFINSVVLRLQINEELNFSDLLKSVKKISLEAISHQDLPFEDLVDILQPERVINMNPIFQVMFAWQNAPRPPLDMEGIHSERVFQKNGVSPLDITFYAWEEKGNILGEIEFCTDILKRSTIEYLKENFIYLLDKLIENPEIPLKNISILSKNEQARLKAFNNTKILVPEVPVHVLFEQKVKEFSDKTAIESLSSKNSLSYIELDNRANQLAHYLRKRGFKKGTISGISMDRSENMVIAVLGVLKAGGTYLPLDPVFPDDRLFYMLEDSGAEFLISEECYVERFNKTNVTKIIYDKERDKIKNENSQALKTNIDINSPAYIIYTSGSTGNPKGVKVHHLAVVNFIKSMAKTPGLTSDDRLLALTTLSFDISVLELFLPISQGATIILADNEHIADGEVLARKIKEYGISIMQATPATWTILLASGWEGNKNLKILCGGEALQPGLAKKLLSKVDSFWNMYGPTETTVWSSCELITDYKQILVGKPIDNTQFYILHDDQELPVGAIGELCIGGLGVSKGYHNRPELTREKFYSWNDKIIYRTGDLGRFLFNGKIELFGRTDNQIKFHGYRIEPGEIEFQLSQIDGIEEAVVKLEKLDNLDERLVGYLNVTDSFNFDREGILKSIENNLPGYMIPSSYMIMKEFPRTLNGKIDRKALVFNITNIPEEVEGEVEDFTEIEQFIAKIWEDILKIKNIRKNQSFFDIGGNSLLAIRVINKIKEEFGIALTFRGLIINSTIKRLGIFIENQTTSSSKSIELVHLTRTTNLPLSINQKRLWLISKLQPDIPSYIIPYTYHLKGSLNRDLFQKSIEILFQRHPVVFSVIKEVNGEPYYDIVPSEVNISFIDYSKLSEEEKEKKVNDLISGDATKVFDLKKGPLYRIFLVMINAKEFYFHISIHHIIFDGWSWPVLVNDLSEIYNSLLAGKEIELEKLEFQQYDYAHWEKNFADDDKQNKLIKFWKDNLKDASPKLNFPYDFQRKDQPTGRGSYEFIQLSKNLSDKLRTISKNEDSSLFTTMLSAFGILLHEYSGENDLNIGVPVAYRPHSKLEKVFGMFVNTVIVRLKFGKDFTFKNIINWTDKAAMNAIANQELPFETIVEIVNPERTSNVNPLFQIGFVWQNNLNIPIKLEGVKSKRISEKERTTPFDIILYLWENKKIIEGEIEYSKDLLKRETIIRLRDNFLALINSLAENYDNNVSSLELISEEEKRKILSFTETNTPYPKNKTIVQIFEEQVKLYPNKKAAVFKGESYTFKQLSEKANQLAWTLRKSDIKENCPVGIMTDKSLDMIVGILSILKAGGGYVPIDPEYPEHRINFIIKDAGCKVLLTQGKYMTIPIVEGVETINMNLHSSYQRGKYKTNVMGHSTDLAYIMYTSGTTGKPKGSMICQQSVVRLVRNTNYIKLTSNDRILLTGAIVFDATTFEIWGALLNGGSLYLVDKETILDPQTLGEELMKNDISILWLTSPLFTKLAEQRTDIFANLKYLLVGGDVLSPPHINKVRKDNPQLKVINGYGPTENTTFSTTYLIKKDFEQNIPIGKPINNSTAYIFDRHLNYQPIGVIGELYLGGDGLSKGYLNRKDLNKINFIDHPHIPGERLYKTGDRARWLADGNIEFQGRIDNQLKIRGFRVEVGEIESIISKIEGVIESVVKPIKIETGDIRLSAFLHVSDTFGMDIKELSRNIRKKLPIYMVPSSFKIMNDFPKTINGKIDKEALTIDLDDLRSSETQDIRTLSPIEKRIYQIWSKILKTKDITITDNFFEIGGNSLLAISVFSRMESVFKVDMGLRVFFDSPRIKDLAEVIDLTQQKSELKKQDDKIKKTNSEIIKGEI